MKVDLPPEREVDSLRARFEKMRLLAEASGGMDGVGVVMGLCGG